MARPIRDPQLLYPGDLSPLPRTTERYAYRQLQKMREETVATSDFPLALSSPQPTDLLRFDGTHWINQSWLPGPFGIGKASPAAQLLTLWPTASQLGLVLQLAAGPGQNALEIRDSTATALVTVGPAGQLSAAQGLAVSGTTTLAGPFTAPSGTISGLLRAGTLQAGPFTVDAAGNVTGAAAAFNSLAVSGSSSLGALATPSLTANTLTVTGAASLNGGLTVTGGGSVFGGLTVDGAGLTVLGGGSFGAGVGFAGSVTVTGALTVNSGITAGAGITATGLLLALTNAQVSGTLLVLGSSTLSGAVACQNGLTVLGSTSLQSLTAGAATLNSLTAASTTINGTGTVTGALSIGGSTNLAGLTAGATRLGALTADSLATTGAATIGSSLNVAGATQLASTLAVSGATSGLVSMTVVDSVTGSVVCALQLGHNIAAGAGSWQSGFGVSQQFWGCDASNNFREYAEIRSFPNVGTSGSLGTCLSFFNTTGNVLTEQLRIRNSQVWAINDFQVGGSTSLVGLTAGATTTNTLRAAATTVDSLSVTGAATVNGAATVLGALGVAGINNSGSYAGNGTAFSLKRFVMTFTSDADYTLQAGEYDCPLLQIQADGVLTTGRNLIVPATGGQFWVVWNKNAQAVTLKVSGQTGITVAAGRTAILAAPGGTTMVRITPDTIYSV